MTLLALSSRWRPRFLLVASLLAATLAPTHFWAQGATISLKTLHTFHDLGDGSFPYGGLFKGDDDNYYGATFAGGVGANNGGTLFRLAPDGALTTFVSYAAGQPSSTFAAGLDGNLYGAASTGGADDGLGAGYRLNLRTPPGGAQHPVLRRHPRRRERERGRGHPDRQSRGRHERRGQRAPHHGGRHRRAGGGLPADQRSAELARRGLRVQVLSGGHLGPRSLDGSTRAFSVRLFSPLGGAALGVNAVAGVSIAENDPPPPPVVPIVTVSVLGDGTATVGGGGAKILFSRDGDTASALTLTHRVASQARNGTDFALLPGTVTIPAGKANY